MKQGKREVRDEKIKKKKKKDAKEEYRERSGIGELSWCL